MSETGAAAHAKVLGLKDDGESAASEAREDQAGRCT